MWEHRPGGKEHTINFHPIRNTYLIIEAGNGSALMQLVLVLLTGKTSHQGEGFGSLQPRVVGIFESKYRPKQDIANKGLRRVTIHILASPFKNQRRRTVISHQRRNIYMKTLTQENTLLDLTIANRSFSRWTLNFHKTDLERGKHGSRSHKSIPLARDCVNGGFATA